MCSFSVMAYVALTSRKTYWIKAFLDLFRVDRHFSGNHQNNEDEAKESYLWVLVFPFLHLTMTNVIKASNSINWHKEKLVSKGPRIKLLFFIPSLHAVSSFDTSCLEHLLDNGADPSMVNTKGYSAVHYAAYHGNKQNLELVSFSSFKKNNKKTKKKIWNQLSRRMNQSIMCHKCHVIRCIYSVL